MRSFSPRKRAQRVSRSLLFWGILTTLLMLVSACGNTTTTQSNPLGLITPGVLTVGSDTTYPPQEFVDTTTGKATGFDIALVTAMAEKMGLKVNIVKADFGTIIDSLVSKRYDVVISAVTINDDRKKKVDFIPYFNAGESLLVPKGNPKNIATIADMCGMKVGVQNGTVEQDDAKAASANCVKAGKPAINITALQNQTDVVQLLATGRVDATYQDSPVTDYYLSLNPGQFQVGGQVVNAAAEGIAVRKGNSALFNAMQQAFAQLKSDGTYNSLFSKWHLSDAQKIGYSERRTNAIV